MLEAAVLCIALNAYHESRGEPFVGQIAVSQVVMRRAGMDERRVCRTVHKYAQFSWTLARRLPKPRGEAWLSAQAAAKVAIVWSKGVSVVDYSNGADHYHAVRVKPRWARGYERVATIGNHIFYRSAN